MREVTHLATAADHHGFAALFPQGFKNTWNVPGSDSPARDAGVDDVSVLAIHGTTDPRIAYQGNSGDDGSLSFTETLAFWAKVDGCQGSPGVAQLADTAHDNTTVTTVQNSNCASRTEVTGYSVNGGGHAWPGGDPLGSVDQAGVTSRQFDASELIWSFLDRHR